MAQTTTKPRIDKLEMKRIIIDISDVDQDDFLPFALAIDTIVNTAFPWAFVRSGDAGDDHLTDESAYPDGVS